MPLSWRLNQPTTIRARNSARTSLGTMRHLPSWTPAHLWVAGPGAQGVRGAASSSSLTQIRQNSEVSDTTPPATIACILEIDDRTPMKLDTNNSLGDTDRVQVKVRCVHTVLSAGSSLESDTVTLFVTYGCTADLYSTQHS